MVPSYLHVSNQHLLYDSAILTEIAPSFFDSTEWHQRNAVFGEAEGRGTALFVSQGAYRFVIRHYRRGGLLSNLNSDHYLWNGLENTRAWREWHLLSRMYQEGLPVPRPVGARVERIGFRYRADLSTFFLPDCESIASRLRAGAVTKALWIKVGRTIRRFHDAGYCHADLNTHNVLIDASAKVYLIDFDKGRQWQDRDDWKSANLKRFHRSLLKVTKASVGVFSNEDWQACLGGYHGDVSFGA